MLKLKKNNSGTKRLTHEACVLPIEDVTLRKPFSRNKKTAVHCNGFYQILSLSCDGMTFKHKNCAGTVCRSLYLSSVLARAHFLSKWNENCREKCLTSSGCTWIRRYATAMPQTVMIRQCINRTWNMEIASGLKSLLWFTGPHMYQDWGGSLWTQQIY